MVTHVPSRFQDLLEQIRLAPVVIVIKHRIPLSALNLLGMLERYNVETCTFFTPVGEMGISPWEMQMASGLLVGEFSY